MTSGVLSLASSGQKATTPRSELIEISYPPGVARVQRAQRIRRA
jgi:hypothetical protein